jgi:hypothetical protein
MKKSFLLLVLVSTWAHSECVQHSVTQISSQHKVGTPIDLIKSSKPGSCTVGYQISVNDEIRTVAYEQRGDKPEEELCQQAVVSGREQLLSKLGGKVTGESITVCSDAQVPKLKLDYQPVKIGDQVLETELSQIPEYPQLFNWNKTQCRMFRERYTLNRKLRVAQGVMCKTDKQEWVVVDKW